MYEVLCQSASGYRHTCYVRASNGDQAVRFALATLDRSEGWRAVYALEQS